MAIMVPAYDPVAREMEQRQRREDLLEVVSSHAGQRFMKELLWELGVGASLECRENQVALYNFGCRLLTDILEAAPAIGLNIMAALFSTDMEPETHTPEDGGNDGNDAA